jgi:integrase
MTVAELVDEFLTKYTSPRLKDVAAYRQRTGYVLRTHVAKSPVGPLPATQVDRVRLALEELRDAKLAAGVAAQTVKLALAHASTMYNWARRRGLITCNNPLADVDKPSLAGRDSDFAYYEWPEVQRLLAWSVEHQPSEFPLYATAVYTGLRLGELIGLRWTDLNLETRLLSVRRSLRVAPKSGKVRHVPINPQLAAVLELWKDTCPGSDEGLVFPTKAGLMRQRDEDYGYRAAKVGAKVRDLGFHELRHTFASHFMMAGGNILTLQRLLGHHDIRVTLRYAHLAPDFMRQEVARMTFVPGDRRGTSQPATGAESP